MAGLELDRLYKLVRPVNYVILLCNTDGVVIDHRGDEHQAQQFRYWGTWLGGMWSEATEGTNGIGTCIAEQNAVSVHRSEHFRSRHIDLSCSGAPIFGPDRRLAGVLDLSSIDPQTSEHAHALTGSLSVAFARTIEERLFRDAHCRDWIFAIRTPDAAILVAVNGDQHITGVDRSRRAPPSRHWVHADPADKPGGYRTYSSAPIACSTGRERDDFWIQVQPKGSDLEWWAIVSPPEPAAGKCLHLADDASPPALPAGRPARGPPGCAKCP